MAVGVGSGARRCGDEGGVNRVGGNGRGNAANQGGNAWLIWEKRGIGAVCFA